MAEITTSGSDADLSFEARWEKALGQPEVSIVDAKKLTIDASPQAILARLRELADLSHAKGELTEQAYASHPSQQRPARAGVLGAWRRRSCWTSSGP